MLFKNFRSSIVLVASFLISGLFVQIFKHFFFYDLVRPVKFFENGYHLRLIEGVHNFSFHSFPSGHSASAFAFFLCIAMTDKRKFMHVLMLLCAILVAYSRVYLSQHFLSDIIAGSFLGILVTFYIKLLMDKFQSNWLNLNIRILGKSHSK